jgi:hypothetical protein
MAHTGAAQKISNLPRGRVPLNAREQAANLIAQWKVPLTGAARPNV